MRIDRLTIQNFNRFAFLGLDFNPRFNLLVGDNGSGKTTVLDALSIAAGSWFLGIDSRDARAPEIGDGYVRLDAHEYQQGRFTFEKQYPVRVEASGVVMGRSISWAREKTADRSHTKYGAAIAIRDLARATVSEVRAGEDVILPLISFYGTERLWIDPNETGTSRKRKKVPREALSRLRGYRNSLGFSIDEDELFDWIEKETLASLQVGTESNVFRVVRSAIIGCIEEATDLYYDVKAEEVVVVMNNHCTQPFINLSDGQRIMLTMVGDLAIKAAMLNPQLGDATLTQTPGIVTVDELDLHLHPRWQRHVIRDLRRTFPAVQFIATTHSPQLIGEAKPDEIILLDGKGSSNPAQSYGMDSNWVLKHVMGTDEREAEISAGLKEVEQLIAQQKFQAAQSTVDGLRAVTGNHPDLVRLSARIDRLAGKPV